MKIISPKQLMKESGVKFKEHDPKYFMTLLKAKYSKELQLAKNKKQKIRLGNKIIFDNTIYDAYNGTISRGILLKNRIRYTFSMRRFGGMVSELLGFSNSNYMTFYMVPKDHKTLALTDV